MEGNTVQNALSKNLVIDTAGFIRNAPLQEFGQNLITLNEVTDEIRDKETKQRLRCLPFELQFMSPDPGENTFTVLKPNFPYKTTFEFGPHSSYAFLAPHWTCSTSLASPLEC